MFYQTLVFLYCFAHGYRSVHMDFVRQLMVIVMPGLYIHFYNALLLDGCGILSQH